MNTLSHVFFGSFCGGGEARRREEEDQEGKGQEGGGGGRICFNWRLILDLIGGRLIFIPKIFHIFHNFRINLASCGKCKFYISLAILLYRGNLNREVFFML